MSAISDLTPGTWNVDVAHSSIGFVARHLMVTKVRGRFLSFAGTLTIADDPLASKVEASADIASVSTGDEGRDGHLKSPDFFDAEKFPQITFKSTKVEKAGKDQLKVTGDLTIKGVTKPVVLAVEGPTAEIKDPWGNTRRGFSATTKINRKDFGLSWSKTIEAGPVVGDEVKIELEGELIKQVDKTAQK